MKTIDAPRKRMKIADLSPWARNPRKIDKKRMDGLQVSIDRFGLVQALVWNRRTKRLVGGHQRLKVLLARGIESTMVTVVDLSETEEKELNVTLNNPHVEGEFTNDLQDILAEVRDDDITTFLNLNLDELFDDIPTTEPGDDDPTDPVVDPVTRLGDLWTLGDHRLLCGDSTDADCVARLLGKDRPFQMVTDPPYGVNYDPEWRVDAAATGNIKYGATRVGKVVNDERADWTEAWKLFPGSVAYVWHGAMFGGEVAANMAVSKFEIRAQIIWRKSHICISRGHYHWQHESCWYAVRKGTTAKWCGDRKQSTIWDIAAPGTGESTTEAGVTYHGTQKPVECMLRPMRNHGERGGLVYDPFLGSGTSLIAAERAGRRLLALEIDPGYCDAAVQRWEKVTGGKAKRAKAGKRKGKF